MSLQWPESERELFKHVIFRSIYHIVKVVLIPSLTLEYTGVHVPELNFCIFSFGLGVTFLAMCLQMKLQLNATIADEMLVHPKNRFIIKHTQQQLV